jgi:pyruvate dehydrogenase E2 component (dihydrolipoamide acetyltransferase)
MGFVRKAMARGMKASIAAAALSQISREVDVQALQELRRDRAAAGEDISLNALIMCAVARTLPRHPLLNAELQGDEILVYEPINLGMAVAIPDGLVVVVIPSADRLPAAEMARACEQLAQRARAGQLKMQDVEGGTFTVSNLGMYGVDTGFPLPRPPESAILLVGAVRPRPVAHEGQIAVRDVCWFSLTYDHRFIDGATAARFLQDLQELLLDAHPLVASDAPLQARP